MPDRNSEEKSPRTAEGFDRRFDEGEDIFDLGADFSKVVSAFAQRSIFEAVSRGRWSPRVITDKDYYTLASLGLLPESGLELIDGVMVWKRAIRPGYRWFISDFEDAVNAGVLERECRLVDGVAVLPIGHPSAFVGEGLRRCLALLSDAPFGVPEP